MKTATKNLSIDWEINPIRHDKGKDTFSADDLIDAYFAGRKDKSDEDSQLRIEKLESNLKKAQDLSIKLYEEIKSSGFNCSTVKLKIKDIYNFSSIFLIDEDDYCDDKFLKIYEKSIALKKDVNEGRTFDFTTIFTPESKNLEKEIMVADGYILSYGLH